MMDEQLSVVKIRNVLMVTIPGDPDDNTISFMQDKILNAMEHYEPKGVILDISMVQIMDSYFARTIVETAQMVKLMGGVTVIAGMQGSVAITATQLGLSLGSIKTALDVDRALDILESLNE
jgi:rsbT antagonist protein RsbS